MHQIAIATDYQGYSYDKDETERTLRVIAEAGISHVHWGHGWDGDHQYTEDEISFVQNTLKKYGLKMKGIHGTNGWYYKGIEGQYKWFPQDEKQVSYTSFDESLRQQGEELLRNRIQLASATGTTEVVLHMQLPYVFFNDDDYKERYYEQAFKSLDAVREYSLDRGVRICIENLVGTPNEYQFDQFDRLFDRYSADYIGYCCDTGHLYLTNPEDPFCIPRKYKDRMYMIHLNDNHSIPSPVTFEDDRFMSQCDEHHVLGDGVIDFTEFAGILADSAYQLPVVGEFNRHEESETEFLEKCLERLDAYTQEVEQCKNRS